MRLGVPPQALSATLGALQLILALAQVFPANQGVHLLIGVLGLGLARSPGQARLFGSLLLMLVGAGLIGAVSGLSIWLLLRLSVSGLAILLARAPHEDGTSEPGSRSRQRMTGVEQAER